MVRRVGAIGVLALVALLVAPPIAGAKPPAKNGSPPASTWQVAFTVQPSVVQRNTVMDPSVVVSVEKSNGNLVNFDGPVTLSYANNPVGGALPTQTVANAVGGVATFADLSFTDVGFGFRLQASVTMPSTGVVVTSPASAAFDVVDQLVHCAAKQSCQTDTVTSNGTSGSSVGASGSKAGILTATGAGVGANGGGVLACTGRGGVVTFNSDRPQTITVSAPNAGLSQRGRVDVCAGAAAPFVTADGTMATYNATNGDYEGLLPACPPSKVELCVAYRNRGSVLDTATILAPPGDPHITF